MSERPSILRAPASRAPAPRGASGSTMARLRSDRMARLGIVAIVFIALVGVFADVLASDLPLLCHFHGTTYVLPDVARPAALATYDNARLVAEKGPGDWILRPLVHFGPQETSTHGSLAVLRSPTVFGEHPLGTDAFGRDVFSRLVHGARTSLGAAFAAALAFVAIGTVLGALAGFFGGVLDSLVARLIETLTAFPTLVLVLVVQALVPHPSLTTLLTAIAFTRWPEVARLVRAEVLLVSSQDYVLAARALGAGPFRILRRHVVPNAFAPMLVAVTFGVASVVLVEASLDFLRVGLPPGSASWGETLSETREHIGAWWLLVFPGLAVFVTVLSLNLVGEALRDALDPRLHAAVGSAAIDPGPSSSKRMGEALRDALDPRLHAAVGGAAIDPGPSSSQRMGDGPPSTTAYDERPHV